MGALYQDLGASQRGHFDRNIRVAPTYPELTDLEPASEGISLAILLGVSEKLLAERGENDKA